MNFVPVCHFPTTILFIDDNKAFLNNLFVNLSLQNLIYKPFTNPYLALQYLEQNCPAQPFLKHLLSQADETQWEHRFLDINIHDLHKEVYNPKRFAQVSTVVIDYDMPGLNGLEVCAKITVPHVRKILLTGAADENLAVNAFNQGLIHKFINKNTKDLDVVLMAAVEESVNAYFNELSAVFIHTLNVNYKTALMDPAFIQLFHQIIQQTTAIEYYLFQGIGSFVLLDRTGQDYGFFLKEKKELQALLESEEIETASASLQQSLKALQTMLCYHNMHDCSLPLGDAWGPYVHPAQLLKAGKPYYYCTQPAILDLDRNKICPFETYRQQELQKI